MNVKEGNGINGLYKKTCFFTLKIRWRDEAIMFGLCFRDLMLFCLVVYYLEFASRWNHNLNFLLYFENHFFFRFNSVYPHWTELNPTREIYENTKIALHNYSSIHPDIKFNQSTDRVSSFTQQRQTSYSQQREKQYCLKKHSYIIIYQWKSGNMIGTVFTKVKLKTTLKIFLIRNILCISF